MALIKKRTEDAPAEAVAPDVELADAGSAEAIAQAADLQADAAVGGSDAIEAPAVGEPASLENSDALLSLFGPEDDGASDRAMLLQMAGEVEVADLVDELRTVAAALRIVERRAS